MFIRKLAALLLCLMTIVSSAMCVNAEDLNFNIFFYDNETEQWIYFVEQNRVTTELEGLSWDESTGTLTLDNFSQPAYKIQTDCAMEEKPYLNLVLKGENELCALELYCPVTISGDGTLTAGQIKANNFKVLSGTINMKFDNLIPGKEYDLEGYPMTAIEGCLSKMSPHYAFLGGSVNISGKYYGGISNESADIEIADTDIRIDIPEAGHRGIYCGFIGEFGLAKGNLKVKDSNIYIRINHGFGTLIVCNSFEDVNHNLKYYTGFDSPKKKLTFEEVFCESVEYYETKLSRGLFDFPAQNCFFITREELFDDVIDFSRYYFEPVYWAFNHKPVQITTGTSPTQFSPDKNVTRGQMVTFLYRLTGEPEVDSGKTFDDVDASKYYAKAISWAASKGITTGYYGTNNFGPDDNCTREQIITFLWRYADTPAPVKSASFTDAKAGAYYLDALSWAKEKNITVGLNDGTGRFGIGRTCTRAMCVTFLYRYDASEK